eukprot:scaffold84478_cov26-Tisochrysis_lutea.AAC.1
MTEENEREAQEREREGKKPKLSLSLFSSRPRREFCFSAPRWTLACITLVCVPGGALKIKGGSVELRPCPTALSTGYVSLGKGLAGRFEDFLEDSKARVSSASLSLSLRELSSLFASAHAHVSYSVAERLCEGCLAAGHDRLVLV